MEGEASQKINMDIGLDVFIALVRQLERFGSPKDNL